MPPFFSPENFLVENVDGDPIKDPLYILRDTYRSSSEPQSEFKYFVDRILSAVSPKVYGFRRKRRKTQISKIFSATDEAFALLFLLNEHHCWVRDTVGGSTRTRKKFTDSKVGSQQGWSDDGLFVYEYLVKEITKRRKSIESQKMERSLIQKYNIESGLDPDGQHDKENRQQELNAGARRKWDPHESIDKDSDVWKVMIGIIE